MTKTFLPIVVLLLQAAACNNAGDNHEGHDTTHTTEVTTGKEETAARTVNPSFASLEAGVARHIKDVFDHYLHVKTALVNSNTAEAKSGATAMVQVIKDFDKSLLPADQKGAYDQSIGAIRTAAGNIASTNDIEKQREHFAALSNHAYALAKSFGGGKTLYHEHCPMAFNDKGAMWLSESKEIKNPYYGEKMMECGTVEEIIEK